MAFDIGVVDLRCKMYLVNKTGFLCSKLWIIQHGVVIHPLVSLPIPVDTFHAPVVEIGAFLRVAVI